MKRTNQQTLIMTQLTLHSSSWESMTSRWEILTAEFRIQALAHRTVKANPKPGGLAAEWHRASLGRIESTSHIPDTFIVCARATDCESLYVWARGRDAARQFMGGNEKKISNQDRQYLRLIGWRRYQTSLSLWLQCRYHDSTTSADQDMCVSVMLMSRARQENTWAQTLRARLTGNYSLLTSFVLKYN